MNIINKLPYDLHFLLLEFFSGKCNKCNHEYCYNELNHNCVIFQYYSVFDEDYYFQKNPQKFKYLCNTCKKEYYETKEKSLNNEIILFDYFPLN
jgi:hydrogenase maturation factor HypF (carbamoyltransferase family)